MSEFLAYLTAGSPFDISIKSTSQSKITPSDIAACMSKFDTHTYLYALGKFCLDLNVIDRLLFFGELSARNKSWVKNIDDLKMAETLAKAALSDALGFNQCHHCNGTGEVAEKAEIKSCPNCNGKGQINFTEQNIADSLNITRHQFRKIKPRYNELLSEYHNMEIDIHFVIKEKLGF